jgi:hypothetical protein
MQRVESSLIALVLGALAPACNNSNAVICGPGTILQAATCLPSLDAGLATPDLAHGHDLAVAPDLQTSGPPPLSFAAGVYYQTGQNANGGSGSLQVLAGDFNGDHHLDLVVYNGGTASFGLVFGQGNGQFGAAQVFPAKLGGLGVNAIAAGDVNGDGNLDLIAGGDEILVLLGDGKGAFPTSRTSMPANVDGIAIADLDGDHRLDLAVSTPNINGGLGPIGTVYRGAGDGTFTKGPDYSAADFARNFALADFNGDGKLDGAILGAHPWIVLGNGDGTFQPPAPTGQPGAGVESALRALDLNGDGKPDIAYSIGPIAIQLGHGDGTFSPPFQIATNNGAAHDIDAADFDGDGRIDLVIPEIAIVVVPAPGYQVPLPSLTITDPNGPAGVVAADFNEDGAPDFAVMSTNYTDDTNGVTVYLNRSH